MILYDQVEKTSETRERKIMKIGIYYGSTTGVTENVAKNIAAALNNDDIVISSITNTSTAEIQDKDMLILGSSTWGYGELQDDWTNCIDIIKNADLSNKSLALFGIGDQIDWSDTFVDAMGILYEILSDSGATFIGSWPIDGYSFSNSKAVVNGRFVGLAIDDTNQANETSSRITQWTASLI